MSSKNKVLMMDFILLTGIAIIGEILNVKAVTDFYTGFYFSITLLIGFITIYRWGYLGVSTAIIIGIVGTISYQEATIETLIVNVLGNAMIIVAAFVLNKITRERVLTNPYWGVVYVVVGYVAIIMGRSVLLAMMDMTFVNALLLVSANEMLNLIAITILFALLTKQKALLIDLRRI